jgi:hypothetical protein
MNDCHKYRSSIDMLEALKKNDEKEKYYKILSYMLSPMTFVSQS